MYHALSHVWASEAFGMEGSSFDSTDIEPAEKQKSVMAYYVYRNEEKFMDVFDGSYFAHVIENHYKDRLKTAIE